ncbi:MAG TPA: hypothetical protein VH280_16480 [Verrucomicrobiae bacterium]|jgi:hypothetical protein|nr:hypothetical protein [Verrucomicrobiae bacterium]
MNILSKTFLTVAIVGLAGGSVIAWLGDAPRPLALAAVLPLGVVAWGLFLIVFALQKEVAVYDREQAMKGPAPRGNTVPARNRNEIYSPSPTAQLKENAV